MVLNFEVQNIACHTVPTPTDPYSAYTTIDIALLYAKDFLMFVLLRLAEALASRYFRPVDSIVSRNLGFIFRLRATTSYSIKLPSTL